MRERKELAGTELPTLDLEDWRGAESLNDFTGKTLIIDFWATWCQPCLGAIPRFNALIEKYGDRGVAVLGICATTGAEKMDEIAAERNIAYPLAKDVRKSSEKALGVGWFPFHLLVDRKGVVREAGMTLDRLEEAIEELLVEEQAGS